VEAPRGGTYSIAFGDGRDGWGCLCIAGLLGGPRCRGMFKLVADVNFQAYVRDNYFHNLYQNFRSLLKALHISLVGLHYSIRVASVALGEYCTTIFLAEHTLTILDRTGFVIRFKVEHERLENCMSTVSEHTS